MTTTTVPFVDLAAQYRELAPQIRPVVEEALAGAHYILGDAVARFEEEFAVWLGAKHAVGVASGLDALRLALLATGIGPGDEVLVPANTFIATAFAVSAVGARPVPVDCIEETHQIDPDLLPAAITPRTRAILPVHLYGHPADMDRIGSVAAEHGLVVVEDAAQAHGARLGGRACGTFGKAGCFSFYPAKNLGAYGDGGIVVTDDEEMAARLKRLRNYGQQGKNEHVVIGGNSRLDSLQAAVLRVKLGHLDSWNMRRAAHAARYNELLPREGLVLPVTLAGASHVFHLYVVRTKAREELRAHLGGRGIESGIHYPLPFHRQPAYADLGYGPGSFPVAERLAGEVLSLPMFPELTDEQLQHVAAAIRDF
ncbi:MAG: DegT/DnrJ/EryC1/StrS family aminotransferase [Candidatus Binatia bacterium]